MKLADAPIVMNQLKEQGVNAVLYGSLGASVYLGEFKQFGDIDLVVAPEWLNEKWGRLVRIMGDLAYELADEHEHEFEGPLGSVAFAPLTIFERDGIMFDEKNDITEVKVGGDVIKTFSPELFKHAYEYSAQDGYRTESRGKKDRLVIDMLTDYIANNTTDG